MGEVARLRSTASRPVPVRAGATKGTIAALDVGSSKIACIIGRSDATGLKVLGAAVRESRGVRSGIITSLELAEQSIREAVDAAEELADMRIHDVILSVACGSPKSLTARTELDVEGSLVGDAELRQILADGRRRCREEGYETIQAAPTSYVVDQSRGVRDPRGMFCERLGASFHAVAVRPGPLQNLRLAVERCHLRVARQVYAPYASALATLTADETSLGTTLIDLGAGVTSIAVFMDDAMVHADSVPIGGQHVSSDIAQMFSTPMASAERIKTLYGSAFSEIEEGTGMIAIPQMGEDEDGGERIRRSLLTSVIEARMTEILMQVRDRLRASGFDVSAGRRAVITGGGCQLAGVRELAGRILGKQVRIARPQTFPGLAAASAGPAYATALGLLIDGATIAPEMHDPNAMDEAKVERRGLARWIGGLF